MTDWQLPIKFQIAEPPFGESSALVREFLPQQSPESSAIATDLDLSPANATIVSYVNLTGINLQDIRTGLFQDSVLNMYICDPGKSDSAWLVVSGYIAGAKNLGDEKFEMSFLSIEEKLAKNVNRTVTERCPLILGEEQCGITAKSAIATIVQVISPSRFVVTLSPSMDWEINNLWQYGSLHNSDLTTYNNQAYINSTTGNIIRSIYLGNNQTEINTLNSIDPALKINDTIYLIEGCGCRVEDCNARGNILNFHGFPDLPGIDKLVTSAS